MSQNTYLAHPRFGFTPKYLINEALTDAALTGTSVSRTQGLRFCICAGLFTLTGGAGEVALILEGSNDDGANWFELARTAPTELFDTDGQLVVLNSAGGGVVDLERFETTRVRATIVSGAPTFSLQSILTGIARDSEKFLRGEESPFVQAAGLPVAALPEQNSAMFVRPAGTLFTNCIVVTSGLVLGTLTSVDAILQGRVDNPQDSALAETWIDIGTVSIIANGAVAMTVNSERLFSMGPYPNFRFHIEGTGNASATTAFENVTFHMSLDSADWTQEDAGGAGSSFSSDEVFISAQFGVPSAEVGNTITVAIQLFAADGSVLSEARPIECIVYDTLGAGDFDLAAVAIFSAVAGGTAIAGVATNRVLLTTDATGAATLSILDAAVESVYVTAVQPRAPIATPQLLASSEESVLTFV